MPLQLRVGQFHCVGERSAWVLPAKRNLPNLTYIIKLADAGTRHPAAAALLSITINSLLTLSVCDLKAQLVQLCPTFLSMSFNLNRKHMI